MPETQGTGSNLVADLVFQGAADKLYHFLRTPSDNQQAFAQKADNIRNATKNALVQALIEYYANPERPSSKPPASELLAVYRRAANVVPNLQQRHTELQTELQTNLQTKWPTTLQTKLQKWQKKQTEMETRAKKSYFPRTKRIYYKAQYAYETIKLAEATLRKFINNPPQVKFSDNSEKIIAGLVHELEKLTQPPANKTTVLANPDTTFSLHRLLIQSNLYTHDDPALADLLLYSLHLPQTRHPLTGKIKSPHLPGVPLLLEYFFRTRDDVNAKFFLNLIETNPKLRHYIIDNSGFSTLFSYLDRADKELRNAVNEHNNNNNLSISKETLECEQSNLHKLRAILATAYNQALDIEMTAESPEKEAELLLEKTLLKNIKNYVLRQNEPTTLRNLTNNARQSGLNEPNIVRVLKRLYLEKGTDDQLTDLLGWAYRNGKVGDVEHLLEIAKNHPTLQNNWDALDNAATLPNAYIRFNRLKTMDCPIKRSTRRAMDNMLDSYLKIQKLPPEVLEHKESNAPNQNNSTHVKRVNSKKFYEYLLPSSL